jgi:Holliday junction resolvase
MSFTYPVRAWRPPRKQAQAELLGDEPEYSWMRRVMSYLRLRGWGPFMYHVWDPTNAPAGWPDIVALRGDRGLALECKTQHDQTSPQRLRQQQAWIDRFAAIPGFDARIVRPADWPWIVEVAL